MTSVITVDTLVKRYHSVTAVAGISFSVAPGICFGLLGPNGAGKTTTIEILEGIQKPSSGEVLYFGRSMASRQLYQNIGIQFQHTALQDNLTVRDTLKMFAGLYEQPLPIEEVIELCSLEAFTQQDTRRLSGGQRQRLLLALALINDPGIVFLDEPTSGLDPQARQHFWELVETIKAQGKTVILTTHYMEEAELLCDDIVIMDQGQIIAQGAPSDLLAQHFDGALVCMDYATGVPDSLLARYRGQRQGQRLEFQTDQVNHLLSDLIAAGVTMHHLEVQAPNLNDLFLKLTGQALRV